MGSLTNYAAQATLNALFGKTSAFGALGSRPTLYVAASTTAPAENGTGVSEPSGAGYARVATAPSDWTAASLADPSSLANSADIAFNAATGAWGTLSHFAIFDAASGGNLIASGALLDPSTDAPRTRIIESGDALFFAIGGLTFTLD
ncbi:MAG: hypothetical protein AAF192_01090 [Pseudomonadota bacterium]